MARVEMRRHVAADPASVALLLAEPTSWSDPHHGWVVAPPRRIGESFAVSIDVLEPSGRLATGALIVKPAADVGCDLRLVISARSASTVRTVEPSAVTFLELLADRAQARSFAA